MAFKPLLLIDLIRGLVECGQSKDLSVRRRYFDSLLVYGIRNVWKECDCRIFTNESMEEEEVAS